MGAFATLAFGSENRPLYFRNVTAQTDSPDSQDSPGSASPDASTDNCWEFAELCCLPPWWEPPTKTVTICETVSVCGDNCGYEL